MREKPEKHRQFWSPEEEKQLEIDYVHRGLSIHRLGKKYGRTPRGIERHCTVLGLKRLERPKSSLKEEEVLKRLATEIAVDEVQKMVMKHVKAIPEFKVPKLPKHKPGGDEEVQVLMLSDLQIGHMTPTTTVQIIRNRARRLTARVIRIAEIHRKAYPVKKLVIFLLGDIVQNDRVGKLVSLDELEIVVMDQVFKVAVPILSEMLLALQEHYEEIEVHAVDGNHGSLGKYAATKTNWDTVAYLTVAALLRNQPRITFNIERDAFFKKVKIGKWTFLLVHGDQIPMHMTLPWYGITTRAMRWQGSLPGGKFRYMCLGHFHLASSLDWNDMEIFVNGAFVSDDQWVLKKLGLAGSTIQYTFGVHQLKGVSWRYKLRLD